MAYTIAISLSFIMCCVLNSIKKNYIYNSDNPIHLNGHMLKIRKGIFSEYLILLLAELPVLLISALRSGTGTDVATYTYEYEHYLSNGINRYGANESYEIGYYLMCRCISLFSKDGQALLIVTSIISITLLFICIYKYSNNLAFSFAIYILSYQYFVSFNNIRQSLAMSIGMIAVMNLISNKKIIQFIALVVLASIFHQIALLYLIFLILFISDFSVRTMLGLSAVWFVVCQFLGKYILDLITLILNYIPFLERLSIRLQYFINYSIYTGRSTGRSVMLLQFLVLIIMLILELQLDKDEKTTFNWKTIKYNQFFLLLVYGLDGVIPAVYRITYLFTFLQIVLFPNALIKAKKNKIVMYVMVLAIEIFIFLVGVIKNDDNVFPYVSIWG